MNILGLDPGPQQTAFVRFCIETRTLMSFGIEANDAILVRLKSVFPNGVDFVITESIGHYGTGMAVGAEVFDTCEWIGRYLQVVSETGIGFAKIKRHKVKMTLCGSMQAKDSNIRQALIDRFGPGKEKAIGCKKTPGPLYNVTSHVWSALAVAVTWAETEGMKP
jgi:hypothetical protein